MVTSELGALLLFAWLYARTANIYATECGHETKRKGFLNAFGKMVEIRFIVRNNQTEYCLECLSGMAIRCAWCGEVIFPYDPITLYSPMDKNRQMPDHAVLYNKEHNSYVGCLRWECAETGADRCGFWYPPGEVYRVPSPIEMCLRNMEEGGDGVIIIGDLSK